MTTRGKSRLFASLACGLVAGFCVGTSAVAASANISHSYHASASLANGDIVSLDPKLSNYVQAANVSNGTRLVGVIVASNDSLLAASDGSANTVQVATSGNVNTLVSTLNGDIAVGDQVAVSPFDGVGMKAEPGSHVIGLAQASFSPSSSGATEQEVTDKSGKKHKIEVGYVPIDVAISVNATGQNGSQGNLNGLQKLVQNFTGKTVPTARVVVSLVVAVVSLLTLVVLVYSAIYGGIISVGRNPLAKNSIFASLAGVVEMVVVLAGLTVVVIYFLLH